MGEDASLTEKIMSQTVPVKRVTKEINAKLVS